MNKRSKGSMRVLKYIKRVEKYIERVERRNRFEKENFKLNSEHEDVIFYYAFNCGWKAKSMTKSIIHKIVNIFKKDHPENIFADNVAPSIKLFEKYNFKINNNRKDKIFYSGYKAGWLARKKLKRRSFMNKVKKTIAVWK